MAVTEDAVWVAADWDSVARIDPPAKIVEVVRIGVPSTFTPRCRRLSTSSRAERSRPTALCGLCFMSSFLLGV